MRPDRVVVSAPAFDDDMRLLQRVEDFAVEKRRAMLPERRAGTTLGDMEFMSHILDTGSATRAV